MLIFSLNMIMISILLTFTSHPVSILVVILLQTLLICLNMWTMLKTSWFAYILFLIFLGGLMVLFVYVVSLASNEKFEMDKTTLTQVIFTLTLLMSMIFVLLMFQVNPLPSANNFSKMVNMVFSESILSPTLIIMTYLLFTLIVAVKLASKFEGPMRNFVN